MPRVTLQLLAVGLVAVTIAGCGFFGGKRSVYEDSVAGRPLEVPPGLDEPGRANALVIPGDAPPAGASPSGIPPVGGSRTGASAASGSGGTAVVRIADSASGAYARVGLALERSGLGEVIARDEAALTYTVRGQTVTTEAVERGFLGRMLGRPETRAVSGEAIRVVRIRPDRDASEVVVEDESGNPVEDDLARRLADAIRRRLG